MPISNSYPRGVPIEDQDLFVGTKAGNNRTVNYTAQGVADYLNIYSKVSIGGQMSFQFNTVPNIPKTIAFDGGGGNNTLFSEITQLVVSAIDVSTADITIFLNYLNNSQVLLSEQNQPNFFGHYKITGYTQIGITDFYTLDLEYIGGNGTIADKQYYDLISFSFGGGGGGGGVETVTGDIVDNTDPLNPVILTPTLQQVTDEQSTIISQYNTVNLNADGLSVAYNFANLSSSIGYAGLIANSDDLLTTYQYQNINYYDKTSFKSLSITYPGGINGTDKVQTFQDADGTIALLSDIPTLTSELTNDSGFLTTAAAALTYYPLPTGTTAQYIDGTGALQTFPTIPVVSATLSGIVNNTSLQELGGVDKLINNVRIGKGEEGLRPYV
jgi:hypothetical protein